MDSMDVELTATKTGREDMDDTRAFTAEDLLSACSYLEDALDYRPQDIKRDADSQKVYRFFWSPLWQTVRFVASALFIGLGFLDVPWRLQAPIPHQMFGDITCVAVFCFDAAMRVYFTGIDHLICRQFHDSWFAGLGVSLGFMILDLSTRFLTGVQWSGCLRPFIIFYYSESSRISFMVRVTPQPRTDEKGYQWGVELQADIRRRRCRQAGRQAGRQVGGSATAII